MKKATFSKRDFFVVVSVGCLLFVAALGPCLFAGEAEAKEPVIEEPVVEEPVIQESAAKQPFLKQSSAKHKSFGKLLTIVGWDAERWETFRLADSFSTEQLRQFQGMISRLNQLSPESLTAHTCFSVNVQNLIAESRLWRGELVFLQGYVTQAESVLPKGELNGRLKEPSLFRCEVTLVGPAVSPEAVSPQTVVVYTEKVPKVWSKLRVLNQPIQFKGVFVRKKIMKNETVELTFVTNHLRWYPTRPIRDKISFGQALLGSLATDVGLLDQIKNRRKILAAESDVFYQMMNSSTSLSPLYLQQFAEENRARFVSRYQQQLLTLLEKKNNKNVPALSSTEIKKRQASLALARAVIKQDLEFSRYSVAPLFNDGDRLHGSLFSLQGLARRAVKIEVGKDPSGELSEVARRFGITHYYEVEIFTVDSQNWPLVCCVKNLPTGFPLGEKISTPVSFEGFFFKNWLYRSRRLKRTETGSAAGEENRRQVAPLLIGATLRWRPPGLSKTSHDSRLGWLWGGGFVLGLLVVYWAIRKSNKKQQLFAEKVLRKNYEAEKGHDFDHSLGPY